jgi:hypothetical protein
MRPGVVAGIVSGAVGTLVLDVVSYGDMLVRGRAPSELPARAAEALARKVGFQLGGAGSESAKNRGSALGALLGYGTGAAMGAVYGVVAGRRPPGPFTGLAHGGAVMVVANAPMVAQGLTDPRTWGVSGWVSDILPHAAYGWATVATYRFVTRP